MFKTPLGVSFTMRSPDLSFSPNDAVVGIHPDRVVLQFQADDENRLPLMRQFLISGRGRVTYPKGSVTELGKVRECGTFHAAYKAGDLPKYKSKRFTCHRQGCPVCFRSWASMSSEKIRSDLDATGELLNLEWYHCTFAPDESWYDNVIDEDSLKEAFKAMHARVAAFMKEFHSPRYGDLGWLYVRHPYTIKCRLCGHSPADHNLPDKCPSCAEWQPWVWVFKPHLHLVTNFRFEIDRVDAFTQVTQGEGFVFKNISMAADWGPARGEDLRRIVAYELGHAWYKESRGRGTGMKAVNYGGVLSRQKLIRVRRKVQEVDTEEDPTGYPVPYQQVHVLSHDDVNYSVAWPTRFVVDELGNRIDKMVTRWVTRVYRSRDEIPKEIAREEGDIEYYKRERREYKHHPVVQVERKEYHYEELDVPPVLEALMNFCAEAIDRRGVGKSILQEYGMWPGGDN